MKNKPTMVRWYDPVQLIRTGMRALLATYVGQISDNRELQVGAGGRRSAQVVDYSDRDSFGFDYVADLGEGYDASAAIARLVAADSVTVGGNELPRADLLLFGGDQVYPDPSIAQYCERTLAPYQEACAEVGDFTADLFALPGNHDWYDGLQAFTEIFIDDSDVVSRYPIGCWRKAQTHSYFVLKLPHNWWLIGLDAQLTNRINPSQRDFIERAVTEFAPNDKVILCDSHPDWIDEEPSGSASKLTWIRKLCIQQGANLKLVLTGDMHHYSRYSRSAQSVNESVIESAEPEQLITAGGGGAFLHPTHALPKKSNLGEQSHSLVSSYPDKALSHKLSLGNLFFPILNWRLSLFIGFVYTLLVWFLETHLLSGGEAVSDMFRQVLKDNLSLADALGRFFSTIPKSPEFAVVVLLACAGLVAFNVTGSLKMRVTLGVIHTIMHLFGAVATYCVAIQVGLMFEAQFGLLGNTFVWFMATMFLFGGGFGGLMFGCFLIVSLNLFGLQWTNAFSALRIANYKHFLRMQITEEGALVIHPIKVDKVAPPSAPALIEPSITIQ